MKRKLGMILKILATGTISLFLAACYGMMMQWKRITAQDSSSNQGITGLKVSLLDGTEVLTSELTDTNGTVDIRYFNSMEGYTVKIEDEVDHSYVTKQFTLGSNDSYTVTLDPAP